jgi:hypothetical protein
MAELGGNSNVVCLILWLHGWDSNESKGIIKINERNYEWKCQANVNSENLEHPASFFMYYHY